MISSKLSRLMKMSWDIQRNKDCSRSKALQAAWAICSNEDVTVHYLTKRLNHEKPVRPKNIHQFALFTPQTNAL